MKPPPACTRLPYAGVEDEVPVLVPEQQCVEMAEQPRRMSESRIQVRVGEHHGEVGTYQHQSRPGLWAVGGYVDPSLTVWEAGRDAAIEASRVALLDYARTRLAVDPTIVESVYCTTVPKLGDGVNFRRNGPVLAIYGDNLMKLASTLGRLLADGFDDIEPRRQLGQHRFDQLVDAGLGDGAEYLDMVVHTFPAAGDPAAVFAAARSRDERELRPAYKSAIELQVAAGWDEAAARCGMVDIAGITVGAAFVGAVASTIVVGDLLHLLHEDGMNYSVASLDLRAPHGLRAVPSSFDVVVAPPFTTARA